MPEPTRAPQPPILIVDDRRDSAILLKSLLNKTGFDTILADSGAQALKLLAEIQPAIIISDLELAGEIDGCAVARAARERATAAPPHLIAVTGYSDEEHREAAAAAGFIHYFVKPADVHELVRLLKELSTAGQM